LRWVSDKAVDRLRRTTESPDFSTTKYRLVRELARGGMGSVFLCEDSQLEREVAIKVLDDTGTVGTSISRRLGEARVIARLEHPGILPVHDLGMLPDGRMFYVMKLVRGSRLDEYVSQISSLSERLRIVQTVCETVAFAHSHGVIHRDLKPQNIMVGSFGEVLVIDWGVAKLLHVDENQELREMLASDKLPAEYSFRISESSETEDGTVIGTPAYMAPEQARGEVDRTDLRTDVYALGAILFFLLTGNPPPESSSVEPSEQIFPATIKPEIPKGIKAVCLKAIAFDPEYRYSSASELSVEIGRFLGGEQVLAYRESIFESLLRWFGKHRFIVLLVLAYLLMRILFIFYSGR
jgi:serine/threonine protein kinase